MLAMLRIVTISGHATPDVNKVPPQGLRYWCLKMLEVKQKVATESGAHDVDIDIKLGR